MKIIIPSILVIAMIGLMVPNASGQTQPTLVLDPIPSAVYVGQTVTFTGKLTSQGLPLSNSLVYIYENDPFKFDEMLSSARTNSNGEFTIPWEVTAGLVEIDFDIYAYFDGDTSHSSVQTPDQIMSVTKYWSSITLDPFPQVVDIGQNVIFSGQIQIEKGNPEGFVVYIKDEDALNADDLMATGYVNSNGRFTANWFATNIDADRIADVYAVVEATDLYYRSTTCDESGMTFDFGGECASVFPLEVTGELPTPEIIYEESTSTYKFSGDEYIELYYALDFDKPPVIALIAEPDSYEEVKKFLIPTQEGIMIWSNGLEKNYPNGDWDLDFDIITPGSTFPRQPDIMINVVSNDEVCNQWAGVAYTTGIKPLNAKVCTKYSESSVAATAGHEFAHVVGSGHAFNKVGDRMCSLDWHTKKPTCPLSVSGVLNALRVDTYNPSNFDLAAITALYGEDGWQDPNKTDIQRNTKLTALDFLSGTINTGTTIPSWVKNNAGWWATEQISDYVFLEGIQFLIDEGIIVIPKTPQLSPTSSEIPSWIKINAGWWSNNTITDDEFIQGIQWLIQNGILVM